MIGEIKETVQQDFWPLVSYIIQTLVGPLETGLNQVLFRRDKSIFLKSDWSVTHRCVT